MGGEKYGHNDISPTKLNSIHHKVVINTGRVERIDSTSYNASCNCEMRLDEDEDGADVGDDVDDDLDDARDDGDDLPFREVISSAESARRRALFFSVGFRHGAAAELRENSSFRVFGRRRVYRPEGAGARGGPRAPGVLPARPGVGPRQMAAWAPCGPPLAPLRRVFVDLSKNTPRRFSGNL